VGPQSPHQPAQNVPELAGEVRYVYIVLATCDHDGAKQCRDDADRPQGKM
jgi:hypothetical protein